jgi:hypothetical protein
MLAGFVPVVDLDRDTKGSAGPRRIGVLSDQGGMYWP